MPSRLIAAIITLFAGVWEGLAPYLGPHVGLAMSNMGVQITRATVFYHFVPGGVVVAMALYLIATDSVTQHLFNRETSAGRPATSHRAADRA